MEEGEEGGLMGWYNDEDVKPIVEVELAGPSGNVFAIMGNASAKLRRANRSEEAKEMVSRVVKAKSYEEALEIIEEYVRLIKW